MQELIVQLAARDDARTEATLQADVRRLLLTAPFDLEDHDLEDVVLESPVGDRRRIDVEVGSTVLEVKRDLRKGRVRDDALEQLAGYVEAREIQTARRYVGVLTDGAEWRCYHRTPGGLAEVASFTSKASRPDVDGLVLWLEGVLATAKDLPPTAYEVKRRLGAGSSAHALDRATLADLYHRHRDVASVRMKRELWARLLTTALGSQFDDSDDLFVEHTLLVVSAEVIAHAVLGLPVTTIDPASMLSGDRFESSGIHGVVEADFFDWVLETAEGEGFVRTLARRLARFDWSRVDHDILKVLYESVIRAETRKKLGEYYTPDWLAEKVVAEAVSEPLAQRVLDPACGSGTFLFHAVRRYIEAAEAAGLEKSQVLSGVTAHVAGMDLHPVAVTLARVTYLLALGRERLAGDRGELQIPVYLGDALQWYQKRPDLWTRGRLVIRVDDRPDLLGSGLEFPSEILADARTFDGLVAEMAHRASEREPGSPVPSLAGALDRLVVADDARDTIVRTFEAMCRLHDRGRDHIWGYYIRNLARPVWLARPENRVDVLVGNPPWLAYRHMTRPLQDRFRAWSEVRGLWHGATVATQQDLSGLFVVRAAQLYLRRGGRLAFVMPNAALDRAQFAGFRTGAFPAASEETHLAFERSWDLRRLRPHFFPRGAAVVFATRAERSRPLPAVAEVWSGRLPEHTDVPWAEVADRVERAEGELEQQEREAEPSRYRRRFFNGATIVPRCLFFVERLPPGPLGMAMGKVEVRSQRSAYEKPPWRDLDALEGVIEEEFLRPVYLGESVLPFRVRAPRTAVIPVTRRQLLDGSMDRLDRYPGLAKWWRRAEQVWLEHRSSDRLTLREQLDYRNKLSTQLLDLSHRIVYGKSGMHLTAASIRHRWAVIDHKLYWAKAASEDEAHYLCAILNSAAITQAVRPLMSYGKDERDIDKHVWKLPIPWFDAGEELHAALAKAGARAEAAVAELEIDDDLHFVAARRRVRGFLQESDVGRRIEELVRELLG